MGNSHLLLLFNFPLTLEFNMLKCVNYLEVTKMCGIFVTES